MFKNRGLQKAPQRQQNHKTTTRGAKKGDERQRKEGKHPQRKNIEKPSKQEKHQNSVRLPLSKILYPSYP